GDPEGTESDPCDRTAASRGADGLGGGLEPFPIAGAAAFTFLAPGAGSDVRAALRRDPVRDAPTTYTTATTPATSTSAPRITIHGGPQARGGLGAAGRARASAGALGTVANWVGPISVTPSSTAGGTTTETGALAATRCGTTGAVVPHRTG